MINIKPSPDQTGYAGSIAKKSNIKSKYSGTQLQQAIGFLGETIVCDKLGFLRPAGEGFNGGFDLDILGQKVDVKTMNRTTQVKENYVHNFLDHQKGHPADCFVFCSYNRVNGILTVCGFISKKDFFRLAVFYKEGELRTRADGKQFPAKGDMYEIQQNQLMPINKIKDIVKYIEREIEISRTGLLLK